jgi:hypothetical protein
MSGLEAQVFQSFLQREAQLGSHGRRPWRLLCGVAARRSSPGTQ